jgi:4-hydroxyphenylacetate 3-monooxygenase
MPFHQMQCLARNTGNKSAPEHESLAQKRHDPDRHNGVVLPNGRASSTYRLFMTEVYPAVRAIVEKVIASGLIYLPSHARDCKNPKIDKYLARYVRGSSGIDYKEGIKIMKLLWDAIGTSSGLGTSFTR